MRWRCTGLPASAVGCLGDGFAIGCGRSRTRRQVRHARNSKTWEVRHAPPVRLRDGIGRMDRGLHRRARARRQQVSRADGAPGRAVLRRQHDRPARPHRRREARRALEAAGDRRKPARPRRYLQRGQGDARRLHADADLQRPHRHRQPEQEPVIRPDQGFRRREPGRHDARHPGGAAGIGHQIRQGPDRCRQGQAGGAQLRLRRPRQHDRHRRRAAQADHRHRYRARSLPRPARVADGRHSRRRGHGLHVLQRGRRPGAERQDARAGGDGRQAPSRPA